MVGGYSPAKLRRYQDIIDAYLVKGDEKVLNMLNTEHIIDQQEPSHSKTRSIRQCLVGEY
ncbi:MAG: hypothetical protein IPO25_23385 [Saprospiraceae bacterium]|nr:hypothetical protein [Saprospiraceae bacterium]